MTRMARRSPKPTWRKALAADAVLFGAVGGPKWDKVAYEVRPEAGLLRLRKELAAVRQSAAGDLLSGARRCLLAEAGGGRGARHPDRARADRRRLFRRAEGDPRPRQRPEARHRHAGLRHVRDRAHRRRRLRAGAHAAQPRHLDGKAQRHEVGRAVERGGDRDPQGANIPTSSSITCWPTPAACSSCAGPSSST